MDTAWELIVNAAFTVILFKEILYNFEKSYLNKKEYTHIIKKKIKFYLQFHHKIQHVTVKNTNDKSFKITS